MQETHWTGLSRPSWEREVDLQLLRQQILLYWAGIPNQHRRTNRLYRQMRTEAAQREISRANGEKYVWRPATAARPALTGYATTAPRCSPMEPIFGTKSDDGLWWLTQISARTTTDGEYLVRYLDDSGTDQASALSGSLLVHDSGRR